MIKKLFTIWAMLIIASSFIYGQWANLGPWPDDTYKGGTHGIAVSPDGKVWQSSYYGENWVTPDNDTILTSAIYVFNADGTLDDILYTVTDGTTIDTLDGACRGMGVDENGNKRTGEDINTVVLANNASCDPNGGTFFSHTTSKGTGLGCVRINLTLSDPETGKSIRVMTGSLMRNIWPR